MTDNTEDCGSVRGADQTDIKNICADYYQAGRLTANGEGQKYCDWIKY